jgi:putative membrane protein
MILPGISGAFLLVILGKYEFILSAVNDRDIVSIAYIGIGAIVGLILFSQVLGWLFAKYHDRTIALLTGLMIGSLRKIWPWKEGEINTIPTLDSAAWEFIGFMLVGCVLVVAIEMIATRKR